MAGQRRAPQWLTGTTYAHRGWHTATVPENSLEGAERAIAASKGIECDVQRSADGTAFVFHDWDLDRLTNASGPVGDQSDTELERLSLLGTRQSPMPLARFVEAIDGRAPLLIEIKSKPGFDVALTCQSVCDTVSDYVGSYAVMSFDPKVLIWFHERAPKTWLGLVGTDSYLNGFEGVWRNTDILDEARPDFLAIDRRDLAHPTAVRWRAAGKPLLTWTVRTAEERAVAETLVDALIAEGEALL